MCKRLIKLFLWMGAALAVLLCIIKYRYASGAHYTRLVPHIREHILGYTVGRG